MDSAAVAFTTLDYVIFGVYLFVIVGLGLWVSQEEEGEEKDSADYFLASKALPFWAIGSSLIAANISAEQFIGMSGSGFRVGLAIASYEWMAAVALLVIAWFFLPIYLEKEIYTMPQFLEERYDGRVRMLLAIFWLLVYVFVNLTSVLYMGGLSINVIMGFPLWASVLGLAAVATAYSLYGGLKAVAWTDVVQVVVLVGGGLLTTWVALDAYGGSEAGVVGGFTQLMGDASGRFNMILFEGELMYRNDEDALKDAYQLLPGLSVLFGGLWVANLFYWGCNQYIIQRALAAKSLKEAQRGLAFAGYLKLLLPLIVVVPGIVAFALDAPIQRGDEAYPWLLGEYVGSGFRGLAFAALVAAIISSLASMMNSASTIFTMDLYRNYTSRKDVSERRLVRIGRAVALICIVVAAALAPQLADLDQVFQYIQEYTGFVSPGVLAIFVLGLFWSKATPNAALVSAVLSIPLSAAFKFWTPGVAFLNRMLIVFFISVALIVAISLLENEGEDHPKAIDVGGIERERDPIYNVAAFGILAITAALYAFFW
ncbi:sodium/sugar symporter [Salinibacter ruber]|uniref:SSS family solute:Na+ symporter n=1 Tax=Salinibacter ruber TaxID=146919 RepID=A0A9X2UMJ8_9BACT|nr:sodium/sugar symporter [Salinibacter ruber]MCS3615946.1 SSS family solute:Na+ symporter [Salinibacter ruber]MCS4037130.1 SSS family solute:Na+ symporter [Salinibacter ruber]